MNLVSQLTENCDRDDCSISLGGMASTCMAWSPTYDKRGNRMDHGDPNITTQSALCQTCRQRWVAKSQYGVTEIKLIQPAPAR